MSVILALAMSLSLMSFAAGAAEIAPSSEVSPSTEVLSSIPVYCLSSNANMDENIPMAANSADFSNTILLTKSQTELVFESPVYAQTLSKVQELIDSGLTVSSVTLKIPSSDIALMETGDPNDVSYWERNTVLMRTYNGYQIRYAEAEIGITTPQLTLSKAL